MDLPIRKNIRLKDYDYSQNGAYFITICTNKRHEMLGKICRGDYQSPASGAKISLSEYGLIAEKSINKIVDCYLYVFVDKYVVMPNHIHIILLVQNGIAKDGRLIIAPTISTVIQQLKRYVSKQIGFSIWQKSFHDHIIRNEEEYLKICEYIDTNPQKWQDDCYYLKGTV
jgi:putative transposase